MGGQMNIIFSSTKKQNLKPDKLPKPAQLGKLQILKLVNLRSHKRARAGPGTPEVAKRLLDGVPGPCFWLVVEYAWLGNWRRP